MTVCVRPSGLLVLLSWVVKVFPEFHVCKSPESRHRGKVHRELDFTITSIRNSVFTLIEPMNDRLQNHQYRLLMAPNKRPTQSILSKGTKLKLRQKDVFRYLTHVLFKPIAVVLMPSALLQNACMLH